MTNSERDSGGKVSWWVQLPWWVRLFVVVGVVLVIAVVVMLFSGHGPGRHMSHGVGVHQSASRR